MKLTPPPLLLSLLLLSGSLQAIIIPKKNLIIIPDAITINSKSIINSSSLATTAINSETIKATPAIEVTELLREEQSMARLTNTSGDGQPAISLRGFGDNASANSLVMIDGFSITNPSLLSPNLNSLSLLDIKTIDIFQGSRGVLYGNQAVGGVVNIVTKTPQKLYKQILFGLGHPRQYIVSLSVGNRFDDNFLLKLIFH